MRVFVVGWTEQLGDEDAQGMQCKDETGKLSRTPAMRSERGAVE